MTYIAKRLTEAPRQVEDKSPFLLAVERVVERLVDLHQGHRRLEHQRLSGAARDVEPHGQARLHSRVRRATGPTPGPAWAAWSRRPAAAAGRCRAAWSGTAFGRRPAQGGALGQLDRLARLGDAIRLSRTDRATAGEPAGLDRHFDCRRADQLRGLRHRFPRAMRAPANPQEELAALLHDPAADQVQPQAGVGADVQ